MKQCQNCGSAVSEKFGKVYGDNSDAIQNCPECVIEAGYRKEIIYRGGCAAEDLEALQQKIKSTQLD